MADKERHMVGAEYSQLGRFMTKIASLDPPLTAPRGKKISLVLVQRISMKGKEKN